VAFGIYGVLVEQSPCETTANETALMIVTDRRASAQTINATAFSEPPLFRASATMR